LLNESFRSDAENTRKRIERSLRCCLSFSMLNKI
jgi:hypothetical protein